jgi:hypothetical protein
LIANDWSRLLAFLTAPSQVKHAKVTSQIFKSGPIHKHVVKHIVSLWKRERVRMIVVQCLCLGNRDSTIFKASIQLRNISLRSRRGSTGRGSRRFATRRHRVAEIFPSLDTCACARLLAMFGTCSPSLGTCKMRMTSINVKSKALYRYTQRALLFTIK